MTVRKFDFTVGPEQSAPPAVNDPSGPDDLITQGYADARYTQGSEAVADTVAIEAIAETERRDGDFVLEKAGNKLYRFDSSSSASADGTFVLVPDTGSGRWIRITDLNKVNTFTQSMTIEGDLTVNGTTTSVNTDVLDVEDANITVNKGGNQATADSNDAGITVEMSDATDALIGYDSLVASKFKAGESGSESEILTAAFAQTITGVKTFNEGVQVDTLSATPSNADTDKVKIYAKDDGKVYKIDDTGTEVELGAGASGSGEINFIDNFDAESGLTTGWATYADAAGSEPVDGTGGSATVAFTAQSTVSLRGDNSFRLSKPASNAQGMGVSYDFAIGEQDQNRKLKIQFDFKSNEDAGFTQGYLKVFIYDIDNAQLITPVDTDIPDTASIFQTSWFSTDSTNYRLIFHVATADAASGWDFYVDNVIVGPGMTSQGAVVGPVEEYILSESDFTNGAGINPVGSRILYQRVGDQLYVDFFLRCGGDGSSAGAFDFRGDTWLSGLGLTRATLPGGLWFGTGAFGLYQLGSSNGGKTGNFIWQVNVDFYSNAVSGTLFSLAGTDLGNTGTRVRDISFQTTVAIAEWQGQGIVPMLSEDNLSNWQSFTPTWAGLINTSTNTGFYRRVGDSMEIITHATASGVVSTTIALSPPLGLTLDNSKFTQDMPAGIAWGFNASSGQRHVGVGVMRTANNIIFSETASGTGNWAASAPFGEAWASGDLISTHLMVPILEWAGSQNSLVGYSLYRPDEQTGLIDKRGVLGRTSGTAISAGYVGEYIKADCTANTNTVTADTYVDVTGASITLQPGVYVLGYNVCAAISKVSATIITDQGNRYANVVITDSSNVEVANTKGFYFCDITNQANEAPTIIASTQARQTVVNISSTTTYKLRLRCGSSSADAVATVFLSGNTTGTMSGDDNDSNIYAIRIA